MDIGGYSIVEVLREGTFGKSSKAKKGNNPVCVLKQVKRTEDVHFKKEITKLKHANIIDISEIFTQQENVYVAMELCEDGNLNDYFIETKPNTPERLILMLDMAKGMNYLHANDVVHGRLKAENILIKHTNGRYVCKVSDFLISGINSTQEDLYNCYIHNPGFIPPEMQDGKEITKSTDVFTVGLIFFAVFRATVLKDSATKESLIPGKLSHKGNIEYLNATLRDKPVKETIFLDSYFQKGDAGVGKLLYSMLRPVPNERCEMEQVFLQIVQVQTSYEYKKVLECNKEEDMLQSKCKQLKTLQSQLETAGEDTSTPDQNQQHLDEVKDLGKQFRVPFPYSLIILLLVVVVSQIHTAMNTQNININDIFAKVKQLQDENTELLHLKKSQEEQLRNKSKEISTLWLKNDRIKHGLAQVI